MSLVAIGSAKGSPGVTTLVAALASRWPAHRRLLVAETDPAGGDLGARLGLGAGPGLVTLAADGRRQLTPQLVQANCLPLPGPGTVQVLVGPVGAEQANAALAAMRGRLAGALAGVGVDVVADCGRLDPGSPALGLAQSADLVVMVARPDAPQLHHLASRVAALGLSVPLALVVIGDRPYGLVEAAAAVGAEPLGTIAADARAAGLLAAGAGHGSRLVRTSPLLRTARTVAGELVARLAAQPAPVVAEAAGEPEEGAPAPAARPSQVREPGPRPAAEAPEHRVPAARRLDPRRAGAVRRPLRGGRRLLERRSPPAGDFDAPGPRAPG